jgi:leucyl/phenylalanyl-tRNA--protein transferase
MSSLDPDRPTPELLLRAYAAGAFPMAEPGGAIHWYSPDPRAILPLDALHVSKTLRRKLQQRPFELRTDTRFEAVMRACSEPRSGREETWIDERLVEAYVGLHRQGCAHSIEAWLGDALVGGLYGVSLGGGFFGESMFSRPELGGTDASKICLVQLVETLRAGGYQLLDTQFWTPHLGRLGVVEVSREDYLRALGNALEHPGRWPSSLPAQNSSSSNTE